MITHSTRNNPYEFVRMEKWTNPRGQAEGYVGHTRYGDTYLTWEVQEGLPVFSSLCRIGNILLPEDYTQYRKLYYRLSVPLISCDYHLSGLKQVFSFTSGPLHRCPPVPQEPYSRLTAQY
jgi:hypothetical protein